MNNSLFNLNDYDPRMDNCHVVNGDILKMEAGDFPHFGKYRAGILDTPWKYDNPKDHSPRLGGYTYNGLPMWRIFAALSLIDQVMAQDSLLFIWWTWPKLDEFISVYLWLCDHGYENVTGMPWVKVNLAGKPRFGIGHWWGSCTENVVMLRRGNISPPQDDKYLGLLADEVIEHSRKPDSVHDLAEMIEGPYIEFFAKRPRANWTVVGNELGEFVR